MSAGVKSYVLVAMFTGDESYLLVLRAVCWCYELSASAESYLLVLGAVCYCLALSTGAESCLLVLRAVYWC